MFNTPHNIFRGFGFNRNFRFFTFLHYIYIIFKIILKKKGKYHFLYIIFVTLNFLFILPTGSIFNNYFAVLSFYVLAALWCVLKIWVRINLYETKIIILYNTLCLLLDLYQKNI